MKKGMELLGADFVLDEFHLKKYVKRMVRSTGEQEREAEVNEWIKEGKEERTGGVGKRESRGTGREGREKTGK